MDGKQLLVDLMFPVSRCSCVDQPEPPPYLQYYIAGNCFTYCGKLDEAEEWYSRAIMVDATLPHVFLQRSIVRMKLKKYCDAYNDAVEAILKDGRKQFTANSNLCKGMSAAGIKKFEESKEALIKSLEIEPSNDAAAGIVLAIMKRDILVPNDVALNELEGMSNEAVNLRFARCFSTIDQDKENIKKDIDFLLALLHYRLREHEDDFKTSFVAATFHQIGKCFRCLMEFQNATACLLMAIYIYESLAEKLGAAVAYRSLALVQIACGRLDLAILQLSKAQATYQTVIREEMEKRRSVCDKDENRFHIKRQIDAVLGLADCANVHSYALILQGRYHEAVEKELEILDTPMLQQFANMGQKFSGVRSTAYCHVAIAYMRTGNYKRAVENFLMALDIQETLADRSKMMQILSDMSYCYCHMNNLDAAFACIADSMQYCTLPYHHMERYMKLTLLHLAKADQCTDDSERATHISSAEEIIQEGIKCAKDALNDEQVAFFKGHLAQIMMERRGDGRDVKKALEYVNEAIESAKSRNDFQKLAIHYQQLGRLHYNIDHYEDAIKNLLMAEENYYKIPALNKRDDIIVLYSDTENVSWCQRLLERACILSNRKLDGLEVVDRSRAISMLKKLQNNGLNPSDKSLTFPTAKEIIAFAELHKTALVYYSVIADAAVDADKNPLTVSYIAWIVATTSGTEPVNYVVNIDTGESFQSLQVNEILKLKSALDNNFNSRTIPPPKASANADIVSDATVLYNKFWRPFAHLIVDEQHIIILPSGPFGTLPFTTFKDEHGKRIVEKYQLSIAPSVGVLCAQQVKSSVTGEFKPLVIGNPIMPKLRSCRHQLPGLPYAGMEAERIAAELQVGSRELLILIHIYNSILFAYVQFI